MSSKIRHSGVVASLEEDCMKVTIVQSSACSACKIATHCSAFEQKEKLVEVSYPANRSDYHVGDNVVVTASLQTGFQAVLYGFAIPLALLTITLVVVLQLTDNEGVAAFSGLAILIPYYLLLFLLRNQFRRKFAFTIDDD